MNGISECSAELLSSFIVYFTLKMDRLVNKVELMQVSMDIIDGINEKDTPRRCEQLMAKVQEGLSNIEKVQQLLTEYEGHLEYLQVSVYIYFLSAHFCC